MKKITLVASLVFACFVTNAQEKEKKKDEPAPSGGQEKSITEKGLSAPDKPKPKGHKGASKSTQTPKTEEKATEEKKAEAKKPE